MGQWDSLIHQLGQDSVSVADDGVPLEIVATLCQELQRLKMQEEFRPAGIGRDHLYQKRQEVRADYIHWLKPVESPKELSPFWVLIENLRQRLNQEFFLSLREFEGHFAIYPPGSFYAKHKDQFQNGQERLISLVLYLNSEWSSEHGGQLRIYDPANPDQVWREIEPHFGRLVLFKSAEIYHEVLPTKKERFSLTGWFRCSSSHPVR